MALTYLTFCDVGFIKNGGALPIADGESAVSEAIVPSGSNQQSSASTKSAVRVATDTAVYLVFGANPNAATSTTARFYLPASVVEYFQLEIGNKVAVVTA